MLRELIGWDSGTLKVKGPIRVDQFPEELIGCKLKLRTKIRKAKMYSHQHQGI